MSFIKTLAENIEFESTSKKKRMIAEKWEGTGLLEGLPASQKQNIALLFENQGVQVLAESNSMAAGAIEGYASVVFPIIRRVFGELMANELVSVQPLDRPNGLVFFLDIIKAPAVTGRPDDSTQSIYGGGVVAKELQGGVDIGPGSNDETGFYNLVGDEFSNALGGARMDLANATLVADVIDLDSTTLTTAQLSAIKHDVDLLDQVGKHALVLQVPFAGFVNDASGNNNFDQRREAALQGLRMTTALSTATEFTANARLVKRLTQVIGTNLRFVIECDSTDGAITAPAAGTGVAGDAPISATNIDFLFPILDNLEASTALGSIIGADSWGLEANANIPQISIKLNSIDVSTTTKKLKAVWTPELQQDLAAYHNEDAEAELTGIMAQQMALEVDQEILMDLVRGATAGVYYWSRTPGKFLKRTTGAPITTSANEAILGADFTGNVTEWYQTLIETINDLSAQIHRKTLLGGASFIVTSPEVANILEFTSAFRANINHDSASGDIGVEKAGTLNRKWDVYINAYFPRNLILVGRKGDTDAHTGYIYAPYVPLIQTPMVIDPEDFTPRKGVSTRYGKKMLRPDMYGVVLVRDLLG